MSFTRDFIEKVRDANNIVDLFEEYTSFKRNSGGQLMGRCPLPGHNEKTPSFSVSEPKQVYHCFGCGKSGNIFDALHELKNLSFPEAVDYLATKAGIPLPDDQGKKGPQIGIGDERAKMLKINKLAAQFFHQAFKALKNEDPVRVYVKTRGLNEETIEMFRIGYAPKSWDGLQKSLLKSGAPIKLIEKLGLVKARASGNGTYDLFRGRLMFPIQDHKDEFVGFGGRALEEEQQPKYLNSSESEVFHKGRTFYGLNVTAKFIREQDQVVVVEGYMDLLALHVAGIRNVVATLGTALTEQHAKLLKRFTTNVVILFDGDEAGQRAAERSLPILLRGGLIPRGVFLPNDLDPDEFIEEHGVEKLKEQLESAPELFVTVLQKSLRGFSGSASDKIRILDQMSQVLVDVSDLRLKRLYAEEIAQRLGVALDLVEKSLRGQKPSQQQIVATVTQPVAQNVILEKGVPIRLEKAPRAELFLLNLALMGSERMLSIWESEVVAEMTHPGVQSLFAAAYERYRQNSSEFDKLTAYLMTLTDSKNEISLHLGPGFQGVAVDELNRMQSDCIFQVRERFKKAKLRAIASRMRGQTAPDQLKELEQIVNIKGVRQANTTNTKKKTESEGS